MRPTLQLLKAKRNVLNINISKIVRFVNNSVTQLSKFICNRLCETHAAVGWRQRERELCYLQTCRKICGLGCVNRARVRARVTQPRTSIFLHICTRSNFNSACHWHEGNSSTEHAARLKPCLGRRQTVDCLHQNSYLKWPFPKTPSLPDPVNKQNDATHTHTHTASTYSIRDTHSYI